MHFWLHANTRLECFCKVNVQELDPLVSEEWARDDWAQKPTIILFACNDLYFQFHSSITLPIPFLFPYMENWVINELIMTISYNRIREITHRFTQ